MIDNTAIYIVSGFMDAGKTTLLNAMLLDEKHQNSYKLVLQFEEGEIELSSGLNNIECFQFERQELDAGIDKICKNIEHLIHKNTYDEIWIEWNGMADFNRLEQLILTAKNTFRVHIEKVIYLLDAEDAEMMLAQTGQEPLSQLINADIVYLWNQDKLSKSKQNRLAHDIHILNPNAEIVNKVKNVKNLLNKKKRDTFSYMIVILAIVALYIFASPVFETFGLQLNSWFSAVTGILMEGIPFLFIGTLLSAFIQVMLPDGFLQKIFPKKVMPGIFIAILMGFCLPVCDCAAVPVFKGLIRKGVPLGAAVTFLAVTPVINPIVLLSTYYAFGSSFRIMFIRASLGIIAAVVIGILFSFYKDKIKIYRYSFADTCSCCANVGSAKNWKEKIPYFFRQAGEDFLRVVKYLLIGGAVSATFQVFLKSWNADTSGIPIWILIALLMVFAFFLSLCSTSDAVIARSLENQFPFVATMGFMVFGPMMDVKNYLMLKDGFSSRLVKRMVLVIFGVCYIVILLSYILGGGKLAN